MKELGEVGNWPEREETERMDKMERRPKITLFVDTVSPFAYEAYWILRVSGWFGACLPRALFGFGNED